MIGDQAAIVGNVATQRGNFFIIPNAVLDDYYPRLKGCARSAFTVYAFLSKHTNQRTRLVRMSVRHLAAKTGISRRHVCDMLGKLKDVGMIEEADKTSRGTIIYRLPVLNGPTLQLVMATGEPRAPVPAPPVHGGGEPRAPVPAPPVHPNLEQDEQDSKNNSSNKTASTPLTPQGAEAEQLAAAVAISSNPEEERQTTQRRATTPQAGMRQPMADSELPGFLAGLEQRGIASLKAKRFLQDCRDAGFLRAVLTYFDADRRRWKNPPGALWAMLTKPDTWGFEQTDAGWQPPTIAPSAEVNASERAIAANERRQRLTVENRRQAGERFGLTGRELQQFIETGVKPENARELGPDRTFVEKLASSLGAVPREPKSPSDNRSGREIFAAKGIRLE
jgi:hypothetical protein